ncbi:hypothetical protein EDD36DRAFT_44190 [Exophiala viscosa]|uniref:Uncharacterized protein n=1 Tax=Exophiala viscosa TaxID=2486360 RepID=A0AAN6E8T0_9EURO|nr:hypothetical protein EDD36DRAFT_44190 [Exophiala viscosa]
MPVLPLILPTKVLLDRSVSTANISSEALKVVCAWPVSGQYGPGTRFLYYALIGACILGREVQWLRAACLAAALLFPAVAALHGIVLAAVHVDGAVDMDLYGAFQVCSIGILLAPVTVMLSRNYFSQAGSSIIILWTAVLLAGLVSLTVEFFRAKTSRCTQDVNGQPMPTSPGDFPYGATCGLVCDVTSGPFSPMRMGSTNNIYVIPAPDKLTFNAGTLLSAACCIPAILLLISNWDKIRKLNLNQKRLGKRLDKDAQAREMAELEETNNHETGPASAAGETSDQGSRNGEDVEETDKCTCNNNEAEDSGNRRIRNIVTTPIFGAAILSVLAIGEWNFFSPQVQYQTEPMASIGQWAPIVGTGFALLGSLYVGLAKDIVHEKREVEQEKRDAEAEEERRKRQQLEPKTVASTEHDDGGVPAEPVPSRPTSTQNVACSTCGHILSNATKHRSRSQRILAVLADWRRQGSRKMIKVADFIGTAADDTFANEAFKRAKSRWIHYPGEFKINPAARDIAAEFRRSRDFSSASNPSPSRTGSIVPQSRNSSPAFNSTSPTLPRSDTLQLPLPPSPIHFAPTKDSSPPVSPTEVIVHGGQDNPALVLNDNGQLSRSETHPTPPAPVFRLWLFGSRRRGTV